jgi:hypothetical protein
LANNLGLIFTRNFTPTSAIPPGCVHDKINSVFVYNHWNQDYDGEAADCSPTLECYCDEATHTPTESPTLTPTLPYSPDGNLAVNDGKTSGDCDFVHETITTCKAYASVLAKPYDEHVFVTPFLPAGCVHDLVNDRFFYNQYTNTDNDAADCTTNLQCYCHTDTHTPSTSPTDAPIALPTDAPSTSPTTSPTDSPTSTAQAPTHNPTVSIFEDAPLTYGKCDYTNNVEQDCRNIAAAKGIGFSTSYTPSHFIPPGCVHDTVNNVFVYNHYSEAATLGPTASDFE